MNNNNNSNNKHKYNKIILDFYDGTVSNDYPRGLEPILTKDEYEQLVSELNLIIKNPAISKKYYFLPLIIILFCTFLVFLLYFVDAIDKYTASAVGIIVGIASVFAVVHYYLYKRSENINQQLKQFNNCNSKYGIKFLFTIDSSTKKLVANLYYSKNNKNNDFKYNDCGFDYNDKRSISTSSIGLSTEDQCVVEMDSISNNSNNNNNNHNYKKEYKQLSNNYDDESSSSGAIINDSYKQYNNDEDENESLTI